MSKPAMTGVRCSKEGGDQRTLNDSKYPLHLCYDIKLHPEMLEHVITTLVKFQRGLSRTGSDQRRRQQVGATPSKALSQDRAAGPSKGTVACSPLPCRPAGLSPSTPDPHASPPAWGSPPSPCCLFQGPAQHIPSPEPSLEISAQRHGALGCSLILLACCASSLFAKTAHGFACLVITRSAEEGLAH